MAFGDLGGAVTELVITCRTPETGNVKICKGDAVALIDDYMVTNTLRAGRPVFGEALADVEGDGAALPVKVRGISIFEYRGAEPNVDGISGVVTAGEPGCVKSHPGGFGISGTIVKVDTKNATVHVLL